MGRLNLALDWVPARARQVSMVFAAVAALMLVDVVYQAVMHARWRSWLGRHAAAAVPTTQPVTTQPQSQPAGVAPTAPAERPPKPIEISAVIRNRNVFAPPKPKGHGLALTGVLGNMVLFRSGQGESVTIEEGKSDRGVTVKAINGYEVTIEFEGKTETLRLFPAGGGGGGPAMPEPGMRGERGVAGGRAAAVEKAAAMPAAPSPPAMTQPAGKPESGGVHDAPAEQIGVEPPASIDLSVELP